MSKRIITSILALLTSANLCAQQPVNNIEMADLMRSNGMIYVVVAVATVVLLGFFSYLFATDRKISKIERELREK